MKVFYNLEGLPPNFGPSIATVGNFDGVHLAHVRVLKKIVERAKAQGKVSLVLTFDPHPGRILRPDIPLKLISPTAEKLRLLETTGIDVAVVLPFNQDLSEMTPEQFAHGILKDRLRVVEVHEGYNFRFGRNAAGDMNVLTKLGGETGFAVYLYPEMRVRGAVVSSTHIRKLLLEGEVSRARHLLGRLFSIQSRVQSGRGYGSKYTVPTVNFGAYDDLLPRNGVYITRTAVGDEWFDSVTNIGNRPTFGKDSFAVESHLLDFRPIDSGENASLRICFFRRVRDEIRFPSVESLRKQIGLDVDQARHYFALLPSETSRSPLGVATKIY